MARDATPPHITALFDQQAATQHEHDQLPDGVIAQVRLRWVDTGPDAGMAASVTLNVDDTRMAAAVMLAMEGVTDELRSDVAHGLADLMTQGPDGVIEALRILHLIKQTQAHTPARVARPGEPA